MPICILKEGAKDIRGKDLSEFVGMKFDCRIYGNSVLIFNHYTRIPLEVEAKFCEFKRVYY